MVSFPQRPHRDSETSQHRHHRPRRSWQDHPRGQLAAPIRHARCAQGPARAGHGFQRSGAGARHHHSGQEHRHHLGRLSHQHRRHAGPRRFRRRGGARARHGGLRAAAGRCGGRAHAADPLRHPEGLQAWPEAHRGHQQDRPRRGASGLGAGPDLRSVRPARAPPTSSWISRSSMPRPCAASPAWTRPCATATCCRCSRPSSSIARRRTWTWTARCSCR